MSASPNSNIPPSLAATVARASTLREIHAEIDHADDRVSVASDLSTGGGFRDLLTAQLHDVPLTVPGYEGFVRNQNPLLVFEFTEGNISRTMRSLKRSEVLQECRRSITDFLQAERDFYGSEFPERLPMGGKIGPQTFGVRSPAASGTSSLPMAMPPIAPQSSELNLLNTIEEAMQGPGYTKLPTVGGMLQPRDLRVIDPVFSASKYPAFLVRQACIIVNLEPVRAIIVPGKVFFFPGEGADSEISVIMNRIKESPEDAGEELPFEMRALEAFLLAVSGHLARDAGFLEQDSKQYMDALSQGKVRTDMFKDIKACKDRLLTRRTLGEGILRELSDILDAQETLEMMSWPYRRREIAHSVATSPVDSDTKEDPGIRPFSDSRAASRARLELREDLEIDAAELLLESYTAMVAASTRRLNEVRDNFGSAERRYTLLLNSNRNKMMRINLFVTVTTLFAALCMLVPSIFGMNLVTPLFAQPHRFQEVSLSISCGLVVCILISYRLLATYAK